LLFQLYVCLSCANLALLTDSSYLLLSCVCCMIVILVTSRNGSSKVCFRSVRIHWTHLCIDQYCVKMFPHLLLTPKTVLNKASLTVETECLCIFSHVMSTL